MSEGDRDGGGLADRSTGLSRRTAFAAQERRRQVVHFDAEHPGRASYRNSPYRFLPAPKASKFPESINLAPSIRSVGPDYFQANKIQWHTHANHALSSQVCCLNFLMPLARDHDRLARLVGSALDIDPPELVDAKEGPDGEPWFVAFEWNGGGHDYLNESLNGRLLKRGSNSTSADAAIRFRSGGRIEILLIEWKYTETYGAPIQAKGNPTRTKRYENLTFAPNGPIKADQGLELADFFYEPFYQLLRQQMLAFQLEKAGGFDCARVLHVSPRGNRRLHHVTSRKLQPFGDDAFKVFRKLLVHPDRFVDCRTEDLFRPLIEGASPDDPWATYLRQRYRFLDDSVND